MKRLHFGLVLSICLLTACGWADTLELKNGSIIKGVYMGGSEGQVSFRVGSSVQQYSVIDVVSLKFEPNASVPSNNSVAPNASSDSSGFASRPAAAPAPPAATVARNSNLVTVPTGTRIVVRTIDSIDSDRNHVGDKFAATLEQPIYVNEVMVAPKGADVYGRLEEAKEAGHLAGKSQLKLSLTGIVINGQTVAISTGDYDLTGKSRTASTAKKTAGGAAIGAVIGAVVGGGKGAAVGAGVGAGAGTAVQVATKGDQVHVPSETLLEFSLDQPVSVQVVQTAQAR